MIVSIASGAIGGLLIILLAAPLSSNTDYSERVSNWYLTTAMATRDRPAFVVSPTTDISLESRSVNQRFNREELPVIQPHYSGSLATQHSAVASVPSPLLMSNLA